MIIVGHIGNRARCSIHKTPLMRVVEAIVTSSSDHMAAPTDPVSVRRSTHLSGW